MKELMQNILEVCLAYARNEMLLEYEYMFNFEVN